MGSLKSSSLFLGPKPIFFFNIAFCKENQHRELPGCLLTALQLPSLQARARNQAGREQGNSRKYQLGRGKKNQQ